MPMDFPDMKSLEMAAKVHRFRTKKLDESEFEYRNSLANHVSERDIIESQEIRLGKGWDKWTDGEKMMMLLANSKKV
jgi:hypothetical protein